jgi:hypothetical protein
LKKKRFFFNSLSLGPHTITVFFNRIPIPETPIQVFVEPKEIPKISDSLIEERKYQLNKFIEKIFIL